MKHDVIAKIEDDYMTEKLLCFRSGDSVVVRIWVFEGIKKRLQIFDGVVISVRKRGLNSTFTVRKYSHGEGVERVFPLHAPLIKDIVVKRYGKVRQSKLYYLRNCSGKHARIKERV